MTISRNDHTVRVFFPSTTGEIESRCLHNCWTCKKLVYTDADGSAGIQCLERLNCSNGDKWEADDNTKYVQEHQVKVPRKFPDSVRNWWEGYWSNDTFNDSCCEHGVSAPLQLLNKLNKKEKSS